ncbi:MAG: gamma-glutamyltransferase [Fusobacteriaceae bacterium]|jgi:gamma-glutamyltranspeptidase/glutathione hydrolase|nr:gamma-glutamyltransferase [Fusobacteriaceae bacterium]
MIKFDPNIYPYSSRRSVVYSKNGMVATSCPLASEAGLEILKKGGNAIDAIVAAAATLIVIEPTNNGIGGDAFAILSVKDKIYGLNSSGPSPKLLTAEKLLAKGLKEVPTHGLTPVNVPGIPKAWAELNKKFGKLPLSQVIEPAIKIAREGFPLAVTVGKLWKRAFDTYKKQTGEEFKYWFDTFTKDGVAPEIGDIIHLPNHADTLEKIGATGSDAFYKGEFAEKIDAFSKKYGGYIRKEDLAEYEAEWVEPITTNYRGYDVYEIPPNGHGICALMALNIASNFKYEARETVETYHTLIESMKLAFADVQKYVTDPRYMKVSVKDLLSMAYAKERSKLIGTTALQPEAGDPFSGGTVYLAAADADGNMISYIQSNYMGFGSGMVIPDTGIALHNRGNNFNLDINSVNCVGPGKKPYHTIIPGFLGKGGKVIGPFGVMGGFMQPQGHLQVITNTIDFLMNPQAALDAPRWQWIGDKTIELEHGVSEHIAYALSAKGHDIKVVHNPISMGRGQIIWKLDNGVFCGGTEPRADGHIALF